MITCDPVDLNAVLWAERQEIFRPELDLVHLPAQEVALQLGKEGQPDIPQVTKYPRLRRQLKNWGILTPKATGCFRLVYQRGGAPVASRNAKLCIQAVFGLDYQIIPSKFYLTVWKLPELNGLNLALKFYRIFRRQYLLNPWGQRNDTLIYLECALKDKEFDYF